MPKARPDLLRKAFTGLFLVFFCTVTAAAAASQANVFIYHRFNDTRYPSTNISIEEFRAHLQVLDAEKYHVLPLGSVVETLRENRPLPERCAVVTIDDAYKSFMTEAWPVLKEFGYPATLFVNTDQVGGTDFLDWVDLRQLREEGVELGNHSASHLYMLDRFAGETDEAWRQRITQDIKKAQLAFSEQLGYVPNLFAYPYGEFSNALARLVEELGFQAAFGQQSGVITAGQDMFKLPRFPMGGGTEGSLSDFRQKLHMGYLPVEMDEGQDTVVKGENPPSFKFFLNFSGITINTLRCYASGGQMCEIVKSPDGDSFVARPSGAMTGRRGKYTLTASDASGDQWYWYSQLWVRAE